MESTEEIYEDETSLDEDLTQLKTLISRIQNKIDKKLESLKEREQTFDKNHKLIEEFTKRKVIFLFHLYCR